MMRPAFIIFGVLGIVTSAGCAGDPPAGAGPADWGPARRSDVSCLGDTWTRVLDSYDLNEDGSGEVFLLQGCTSPSDRPGQQLEVVAGGADHVATHPVKLVLQEPGEGVDQLRFCGRWAGYRVTRAGAITEWHVGWPAGSRHIGKPLAGPPPCP